MIGAEVEQSQELWAGVTGLIRLWKYVEKADVLFSKGEVPLGVTAQ